jgi:hypothetical protein
VTVFSYHGWCSEHACREVATKRAQIGVGDLVLMVPLCEEHLDRFRAEVNGIIKARHWDEPPYLTVMERRAVERVLEAAGWEPRPGFSTKPSRVAWHKPGTSDRLDLRRVFPSPFTLSDQEEPRFDGECPCVGCDRMIEGPYPCPHCGFRHVELGAAS